MVKTCGFRTVKIFMILFLILNICEILMSSPLSAAIIKYLSMDELIHQADLIVLGTCEQVTSSWDREKKNIYTFVTVIPQRCLKSSECPPVIRIRQLGGVVDNLAMTIVGSPVFSPKEKVVVFLIRSGDSYYQVLGLAQGKFSVLKRQNGEGQYVKRDLKDLTFINKEDTESPIENRGF